MNTNNISKFSFFKSFWGDIINNGIEIYSGYYFVDLIMILEDITRILNCCKDEGKEDFNLIELKYLSYELNNYIKNNTFYKKTYTKEIDDLLYISKNLGKPILDKRSLEIKIKNIYETLNNKNNIMLISNYIKEEIYSSIKLHSCKHKLQSLAIDYICCLLRNGFSIEYLKKEIFKVDFLEILKDPEGLKNYRQNKNNISTHQFESFANRAHEEEREITYVFKVKGLKIIHPIEINNIYFYNPIRVDILKLDYNIEVTDDEALLLSGKERKIFEDIKEGKMTLLSKNLSEFEYTDCHARICIKTSNIDKGANKAKQEILNIVNKIQYIYGLKNIFIDDNYYIKDKDSVTAPMNIEGQNRGSKFYCTDYIPRIFTEDLKRDLANSNSRLQKILKIKNSEICEKFKKASYWYIKGNESETDEERFLNYWISLEFMSSLNNGYSIKKNILNVGTSILVVTSFNKELNGLYRYTAKQIFKSKNLKLELEQISGMEEINSKVDIKVFANSLDIIYKHIDDEYVKYKIEGFNNAYRSINFQKRYIRRIDRNYKNILSRLYRMRNLIVHNADLDNNRLSLYTNYLKAVCGRLLYNIMVEDEENINEWNSNYIDEVYNQWLKDINDSKLIKIV